MTCYYLNTDMLNLLKLNKFSVSDDLRFLKLEYEHRMKIKFSIYMHIIYVDMLANHSDWFKHWFLLPPSSVVQFVQILFC